MRNTATLAGGLVAAVRPLDGRPGDGEPGCVLVDTQGRAVSVVVVDPAGGVHHVPAMLVAPSSVPADVLRRAMTRPLRWHSAPLVCTDVRGSVLVGAGVALALKPG